MHNLKNKYFYISSNRDTLFWCNRSSHRRCSIEKGVLKNFAKFTENHLCQSLFFNKVEGLRPKTLLKKRLWHRCFLVNFAKFFRTSFLQNTSGRLLLVHQLLFDRVMNTPLKFGETLSSIAKSNYLLIFLIGISLCKM